jgi:hypothetical protein
VPAHFGHPTGPVAGVGRAHLADPSVGRTSRPSGLPSDESG